jgi:hypothetical protein
MSPDDAIDPIVTLDLQLEEVSDAIQRAAADLLAARLVLDRERAELAAKGADPARSILIAATRVVDELRETDEALTVLLKEIEAHASAD